MPNPLGSPSRSGRPVLSRLLRLVFPLEGLTRRVAHDLPASLYLLYWHQYRLLILFPILSKVSLFCLGVIIPNLTCSAKPALTSLTANALLTLVLLIPYLRLYISPISRLSHSTSLLALLLPPFPVWFSKKFRACSKRTAGVIVRPHTPASVGV